jgi:membrane-associated phospholipid phosphatase
MTETIRLAWHEAWNDARLRPQIVTAPLLLWIVLRELSRFLVWVERRPGASLSDPILALVSPRDATWLVFGLIYVAITITLADVWRRPRALVIGVQSYVLMIVMRMAAMYVTALEPPAGMIALRDPLTETLATGTLLTRDLFFSGHTSTVFLMFLITRDRRFKPVLLVCAAGVAAGVLMQHVHYTVDVLVAPLFAFASFRAVDGAHRKWGR